jgi:hypothetical protein
MSKEPVRRQGADDDEDDDREVNSILMLLSTPLLHTIYAYILNIKTSNIKYSHREDQMALSKIESHSQ